MLRYSRRRCRFRYATPDADDTLFDDIFDAAMMRAITPLSRLSLYAIFDADC